MIIEWIGCSGTGKSTLRETVYGSLHSSGIETRKPLEIFLGNTIAKTISNERLQKVALDFLVLPWSAFSFIKYRHFIYFCREILKDNHPSFLLRARLLRSILRKTGLHVFLNNSCDHKQAVLVDEGTVQIAHLLFANGQNNNISQSKIEQFCKLVPTPELIIHVIAPEADALQRTLGRQDKPIADTSTDAIKHFIRLGHEIFRILNDLAPWQNKTITIFNPNNSPGNNEEAVLNITKKIAGYLSLKEK